MIVRTIDIDNPDGEFGTGKQIGVVGSDDVLLDAPTDSTAANVKQFPSFKDVSTVEVPVIPVAATENGPFGLGP